VVGFFLPAILLSREKGQPSRCKEADDNTWTVYETGLTLTCGPNIRRSAYIDGDHRFVTQMLKVTRADKFHFRDGC
jgi:hypothetical protein